MDDVLGTVSPLRDEDERDDLGEPKFLPVVWDVPGVFEVEADKLDLPVVPVVPYLALDDILYDSGCEDLDVIIMFKCLLFISPREHYVGDNLSMNYLMGTIKISDLLCGH